MQNLTFTPQSPKDISEDKIAFNLQKLARYIFIGAVALLPIFFIPHYAAPLGHSKTAFFLIATLISLILLSLTALRTGSIRFRLPLPLVALWGFVIAAGISGLLSGSQYSSFIGHDFGPQTVLFLFFFALLITISHFLLQEKSEIMYLYLLLFASGVILAIFQLLRLLLGPEFLSFGLELENTFSILGTWNDLGIFYGLILILSLIALEQLPLPRFGKIIFATVSVFALILLVVIQFTAIWVLVGLSSLVIVMYSLMRHRLEPDFRDSSFFSILLAAITAILAFIFVIGGQQMSDRVSNMTGISYLEVRPSITATAEIARNVYSENVFLGTGPNQFSNAWRQYKDRSINETIFWNTDFITGFGYIPTLFITTGLLGTVLILIFLGLFIWNQYRAIFAPEQHDHFWYFIATSSTVASVFLWIILFVYTPSSSIILLTGVFTAIALVASTVLQQTKVILFDSNKNKRKTVLLIIGMLLVVLLSTTSLYFTQEHYGSHLRYNESLLDQRLDSETRLNNLLQVTFRSGSDLYPRSLAQQALRQVNLLLTIQEPTAEDSESFIQNFRLAVEAASEAVRRDRQRAINWATLAAVYSVYAGSDSPEAGELARDHLSRAKELDPLNPEFHLLAGEISMRENEMDQARQHFKKALDLKSNYIVALNALSEIDIATGNIAEAREHVRRILQLQPNNPGRYYQLAILYLADELNNQAIDSLITATTIDPNFANARYILALQYIERGQTQAAIEQLDIVARLNPGNAEVRQMLENLRSGEPVEFTDMPDTSIGETVTVPGVDEAEAGAQAPDTNLLQSVNPASSDQQTAPVTETDPEQADQVVDDDTEEESAASETEE